MRRLSGVFPGPTLRFDVDAVSIPNEMEGRLEVPHLSRQRPWVWPESTTARRFYVFKERSALRVIVEA